MDVLPPVRWLAEASSPASSPQWPAFPAEMAPWEVQFPGLARQSNLLQGEMAALWSLWRKMTLFCRGLEEGKKSEWRLASVWGHLTRSPESQDDNGSI